MFDLQLFADPPAGAPPSGSAEPKTYDQAYVTRLTNEAAESRKQSEALAKERDELAAFKAQREKADLAAKGEYDKAVAKIESEKKALEKKNADDIALRDRRFVLSEAKAAAIKAGIIDPNDVATIDIADLRIDENGSVAGIDEKIVALKAAKPHWFKPDAPAPGQNRAGASPGGGGKGSTDVGDWGKLTPEQFDSKLNDLLNI